MFSDTQVNLDTREKCLLSPVTRCRVTNQAHHATSIKKISEITAAGKPRAVHFTWDRCKGTKPTTHPVKHPHAARTIIVGGGAAYFFVAVFPHAVEHNRLDVSTSTTMWLQQFYGPCELISDLWS